MSSDVIQANYERLDDVARRFSGQAEVTTQLVSRIKQCVEALERGGWEGRGADAFFDEMNAELFPALQRMQHALDQAASVTLRAKEILIQAEEEAAALFSSHGASGAASPASDGDANDGWWDQWGEWVHGALDVAGFIPVVGEIADGANAAVYLAEGRYLEAGISAAAMIPIVGDAGKAAKWSVKAGKQVFGQTAESVAKRALREGAEVAGERGLLRTYGDALRKVLGRGADSHPEEWTSTLARAREMGIEIVERPGTLAYGPAAGRPGQLILDPDASIGALRHEFRHALDDAALGYPGFRIMADSEAFWRLEFRGYMEEIKLARQEKAWDAARSIVKEMRARRKEIMGE
jgi:WXG100 family type VII secretion target